MTTYLRQALKQGVKIFTEFNVNKVIPGDINLICGQNKLGEKINFSCEKLIFAAGSIGNTKILYRDPGSHLSSEVLANGDLARLIKLLPSLKELNLRSSDDTLAKEYDILEDDDKTKRFVHAHFQNTSTLLETLHLSSNDADALFVVEYTVSTALERNRLLQQAKKKNKKKKSSPK